MICVWEHINGSGKLGAVAAAMQKFKIASKRFGVARNVHNAFRTEPEYGFEKLLITSRAGRIHEHDVNMCLLRGHLNHIFAGIRCREPAVFDFVAVCICNGIPHGIPVQLNTDHLLCVGTGNQADGADSAIGVQNGFLSGKTGEFDGRGIQIFRLHRIDLIKTPGRNPERQSAETILDIPRAVKRLFALTEYKGSELVIYVQNHRGDFRKEPKKLIHKMLLRGKNREDGHEDNHDLVGREPTFDQDVTKKTRSRALIVYFYFKSRQKFPNGNNDIIGQFVLDLAAVNGHDPMARGLINAGNDMLLPIQPECGLHLVAVMVGNVHAVNRLHRTETTDQFSHPVFLPVKLFRIRQVLHLASTAFFSQGARLCICIFQNGYSLLYDTDRIPYFLRLCYNESNGRKRKMEILYQDDRIVVCQKPAGVLSTNEEGGMPDLIRTALGEPDACIRSVHRLDRAVSGVMVYARTKRAAAELSEQIRMKQFQKQYLAVVHGVPDEQEAVLHHWLKRDKQKCKTFVVPEGDPQSQEAILKYRLCGTVGELSLLSVQLFTGRTHQIRCQLSSCGWPIVGDRKYGSEQGSCDVALLSHKIHFIHPKTKEEMNFEAKIPEKYPWNLFPQRIFDEFFAKPST